VNWCGGGGGGVGRDVGDGVEKSVRSSISGIMTVTGTENRTSPKEFGKTLLVLSAFSAITPSIQAKWTPGLEASLSAWTTRGSNFDELVKIVEADNEIQSRGDAPDDELPDGDVDGDVDGEGDEEEMHGTG